MLTGMRLQNFKSWADTGEIRFAPITGFWGTNSSGKSSLLQALLMMKRWFGEIINYFERRTTNGVVEGINNKLKVIKRVAYGFRNFLNFRLRCLMCWHYQANPA